MEVWPEGKVTGPRAPGGYQLDMQWQDGKLINAVIRGISNTYNSHTYNACSIMYNGTTKTVILPGGHRVALDASLESANEQPK